MAEMYFKTAHIEMTTDIGAIRYDWLKTENMDKKKVKFSAGPKSATFTKKTLVNGDVEMTQSGENLEEETMIEFAKNWIDRASGHVDLTFILTIIDFDGITQHFEALENATQNSDAHDNTLESRE